MTNYVSQIGAKVSIAMDHKTRKIILTKVTKKRGPGLWKFNNSLVHNQEYIKLITGNYSIMSNKYSYLEDKRSKWEVIKMKIRVFTVHRSKQKARNFRKKEQGLDDRLEELDNVLSQQYNTAEIKEKEQEH